MARDPPRSFLASRLLSRLGVRFYCAIHLGFWPSSATTKVHVHPIGRFHFGQVDGCVVCMVAFWAWPTRPYLIVRYLGIIVGRGVDLDLGVLGLDAHEN
eukprot:4011561-Amphidinium_carterae.5